MNRTQRNWDTARNTNWQEQLLRTAKTTDAQLGFSGGDAKTSFRLNSGFHQETPPFSDEKLLIDLSGMIELIRRGGRSDLALRYATAIA